MTSIVDLLLIAVVIPYLILDIAIEVRRLAGRLR